MGKCLLAIIIAEFKNIFLNKNVISVMIIGPLVYCFFYPQPYVKEVLTNVSIGVLDQDNSTMSRELIRNVNATKTVNVTTMVNSMSQAEHLLKTRQITGILVIPLRFEQKILRGESSPIAFYGDASYILIYNNVATTLSSVVAAMGSKISVERQIVQGIDPAVAQGGSQPFITNMIGLFNPQSGYATYVLPPVFILILHQLLFIGILLTTFSSKDKTATLFASFTTVTSSWLQSLLFIVGKIFTFLSVYLVMLSFYLTMVIKWYDIPNLADYSDILLFIFIFLCTTITFAIALSSFMKRAEDPFLLMVPISILLFFSSGISWPKELIPSAITFIAHLFPAVPSMIAFVKIAEMGAPLALVLPEMYNLLLLFIIYFIIALYCYHRQFKRLQHRSHP
ncbi:ABC-2 type transport system permease protein [Orbus hercynius]|uniref:ABC-2 type transport system permease protein n=1 Tax=Orbus hercynius TaxID=593135 RepID=A0A495RJI4_9GAMM|nr:ABC transporter permease [Orbus hercynius]RKS87677.1 ABC-2 type transport system permease protein [Orbus hercynius]